MTLIVDMARPEDVPAMAAILFFMRTLAPQAPNNAGCLAPARWILPEGSVVHPGWPAAVNARTPSSPSRTTT